MTGAIILAAGASTRLGVPKQMLLYNGKTLLEHATDAALEAQCQPVIVVLGAGATAASSYIRQKPVTIVHNPLWQQGMASSIHAGLHAVVQQNNLVNDIIILLCDQPFADAALLQNIIAQKKNTGKGIVACAYAGTVGVPVLFDKKYVAALLLLNGEEGAKKLLLTHKEDIALVPFEKGNIDIDTANDYEQLSSGSI